MSTVTTTTIPHFIPGTWTIDPAHSEVSFTVRHLMVGKVRGRFAAFSGTIVTGLNPLHSQVSAEIDLASIDTGNEQRDAHLRSAEFLNVEIHPRMSFRSTGVRPQRHGYLVIGELTLHGVTRPVELQLEVNGFVTDPWGGTRAGFSATGEIDRRNFGLDATTPLAGGMLLSYEVQIAVEIEAVLTQTAPA